MSDADWQRFTGFVEEGTPAQCWEWQGARDQDGYGVFKLDGKAVKAHRLSFFFAHGRYPEPEACHDCDNPPCVNPYHLHEGTRSDNMQERADRGRQAGGPQGDSSLAEWTADE